MSNEKLVAIESTYDYTDSTFHQHLLNIDVKNADGSYGKVGHLYRIVDINDEGRVKPFDDRVFESETEAKSAVAIDSSLKLISYDAMIDKACSILTQKANIKPWKPVSKQENNKNIDFDR
jgi:hypothetical protein